MRKGFVLDTERLKNPPQYKAFALRRQTAEAEQAELAYARDLELQLSALPAGKTASDT